MAVVSDVGIEGFPVVNRTICGSAATDFRRDALSYLLEASRKIQDVVHPVKQHH